MQPDKESTKTQIDDSGFELSIGLLVGFVPWVVFYLGTLAFGWSGDFTWSYDHIGLLIGSGALILSLLYIRLLRRRRVVVLAWTALIATWISGTWGFIIFH